jgi:hypothetical protein
LLKKILYNKVFPGIICLLLIVSSTAHTQLGTNDFDSTLAKWLAYIGFKGEVLEYQKIYDENGYIDYFRMLLQENPPSPLVNERTPAKLFLEMTDNESYQFAHIKITEKDIKNYPYMYADWIARYAISFAVKKVSKLLSLQSKNEKIKPGLYRITIEPAATSVPSRYRFTQIEVFYQVKDLFLSLDLTVKGEKNYLILSYIKSELNSILRALENGNFPGSTSEILTSEVAKESSNYLLRDLLQVPESLREKLLELEHNPELKIEEMNPED